MRPLLYCLLSLSFWALLFLFGVAIVAHEPRMFDVLAHIEKDVTGLFTWINESDAKLIANPDKSEVYSLQMRIHKVDTLVSYKNDKWDEPCSSRLC
ncbi:unnamed protein product [Coffea canephora]|uniref:Uncharacterized protein n=1 Tax=Coffea canephora TaxID=49390 RepID=A0A068UXW7_COFCA|nr:unnamed protein product [Coffea canephora]